MKRNLETDTSQTTNLKFGVIKYHKHEHLEYFNNIEICTEKDPMIFLFAYAKVSLNHPEMRQILPGRTSYSWKS